MKSNIFTHLFLIVSDKGKLKYFYGLSCLFVHILWFHIFLHSLPLGTGREL